MKKNLLVLTLLVCVIQLTAQQKDSCTFCWLPQKMVSTNMADARAHRTQIQKSLTDEAYYASVGGQFAWLNVKLINRTLQFSVAGSVYTTLKRYNQHGELINADFFVDLYADYLIQSNWILRGSMGHSSHHLTDDALSVGLTAINYVKDYLQLQTMHYGFNKRVKAYAGIYYFHNFKIGENGVANNLSGNILLEIGTEATVCKLNPMLELYVAVDLKLRQEFDFGTTQCLQFGFKANRQTKAVALAYQFLGGYEERGQFYNTKKNIHSIGLLFDL